MFGIAFLALVLIGVGGYSVYKMGWKASAAAVSALGAGLYAGGHQMWDALSAFFGSVF